MASIYDRLSGAGGGTDASFDDDSTMTPEQQDARKKSLAAQIQANAPQTSAGTDTSDTTSDDFGNAPSPTTPTAPPGMHLSSVTRSRTTSAPGASSWMSTPPDDTEMRGVMSQIQSLKKQAVTPADFSQIDKAEAEAKQLYEDRANRAEWLGVAEKIGNAAIKFGQAQAAIKHNVDVSQMKDLAPTDWDKKIDRYAADYKTDLEGLEKNRQQQREQVNDQNKQSQEDYQNQLKPLEDQAKFLQYKYGQESSDYRGAQRDAQRDSRMMELEHYRENAASGRQSLSDDKQLRALQARDLQDQLKDVKSKEQNATAAAQILSQQENLDPKTLQKLETQYPGILGKAGITPEELAGIDKESQVPGRFYGTNVDPDKRNQLIQQKILGNYQQQEMTLRDAMQHVLSPVAGRGQGQGQSAPQTQTTPPTAPKTLTQAKLEEYATTHSMPVDKAAQWLQSQGYTITK